MSTLPARRWQVRRARRRDGSLPEHARIWDTFRPDGAWSGSHATWAEAMHWATDPIYRIECYANTVSSKRI